jgi:hypothetical protein
VGADLREPPLGRVAEAVVDRTRDRELEDAVPEELEALVRGRTLVRPGRMGEDLIQAIGRKLRDQPAELGSPVGDAAVRPRAGLLAATAGAR